MLQDSEITLTKILIEFTKHNPWSTFFYWLTVLLVPIQSVWLPHMYGRVVNAIQAKQNLLRPFIYVVAVIALIQIGHLLAEYNELYYTHPAMNLLIRKYIMEHLFSVHETNYDEQQTANLVARLVKLPSVIYGVVEQYKGALIPQVVVFATIIGYFWAQDKPLAIGVAIAVAYVVVVINVGSKYCSKFAHTREASINNMYDTFDDMFRNMMAIFNRNSYAQEDSILYKMHLDFIKHSLDTLKCILINKGIVIPVITLTAAFFMWRCFKLTKLGTITTGTFVSMFMIMLSLLGGMSTYLNQVKELTLRLGIIDSFIMEHNTANKNQSQTITTPTTIVNDSDPNMVLQMKNVTYMYPNSNNQKNALYNVNFGVKKGETVLIRGRIGSGKSTLLKLLMKYKLPTGGELYFNGLSYKELTAAQIRGQIGYIPQIPILFNRTLYENIVYGFPLDSAPTKTEVENLMKMLKVEFPEGLDANVGKGGSRLSGGQRQMVWILRVMLQDPPILLLDEPTASIDPVTKTEVHRLIHEVMRNRTVVMVAHDEQKTELFDRVLVMDNGTFVAQK